jgi:ubiquitin-like protein Pup
VAEGQKSKEKASKQLTEEEVKVAGKLATSEAVVEEADKTVADIDGLLDEIDDVLEVNAEEFVKGYIQKGGV